MAYYFHDHDERVRNFDYKRRGRGRFGGRTYNDRVRKVFWGPKPWARFQDDENGDITMSDAHESSRSRFVPYPGQFRRGADRFKGSYTDRKSTSGSDKSSKNSEETGQSWYKVSVTYGKKYDREWLIESIKKCCSLPFTPIEYHYEENKAAFFVQDSNVANALKQVTRKITDKDNYKVKIFVHRSGAPLSVRSELKPEQLEVIKQCMSKRFNAAEQSLSLKNICSDPDLVAQKIDDVFFKRFCIYAVIKIIAEHIPELMSLDLSSNKLHYLDDVTDLLFGIRNLKILKLSQNELKYDRELDKLKGLKLDELWLDENPLCKTFADQAAYISNIRDRFPKLLRLDGHELPPPICFEIASETTLPTCKGSYFCTDDVKGLILHFLQQFYTIYDSDDRQGLLAAYHDNACFSVCTKSPPSNSARALNDYLRENRNLKKVKDTALRFRLLRHKRLNIIAFLNELPKTEHDLKSFVIDVSVQTNTLLSFTVNGIFKEANDKAKDPVMAFSRVFVAVPAGSNGLCIVNDHLCVRSATPEEIRKAFVSPAPTPSSSPVPTLSATQQEMIQAFSLQSGMNFEWSQKCLNDNNWDYTKAAHVFTVLKNDGKIPEMAFLQ